MGKSTVIRASEKSVRRRKERRRQKVERFLTRKREPGERGSDGVEKRGSDISVKERAGLTWDRERERQSATVTMSLGADGEGGIGGSRAGCQGGKAGIKRVRERRSKRGSLVREEEKRETAC